MPKQAELILDARNAVGESPVWSQRDEALYWTDIPNRRLHRWSLADASTQSWEADEMLACIAQRADGSWVAGMQSGIFQLIAGNDGRLTGERLVGVSHAREQMRFNDGRCDRQGRFWTGSMLMDMAAGANVGALYRYDGAGQATLPVLLDDLIAVSYTHLTLPTIYSV